MSQMVERVARAIADQLNPETKDFPAPTWATQAARRAIAAMREPTVAMECVDVKLPDYGDYDCIPNDDIWRAMIDEALK